ncbi:hypothetical protein C8Q75DRAFT_403310 [Abortiporus biennis]|nr:hypothetical protein C8Q75DRAFT_403310 [Abortiporus biennis]
MHYRSFIYLAGCLPTLLATPIFHSHDTNVGAGFAMSIIASGGAHRVKMSSKGFGATAAAIYFITNEPTGNNIIVGSVDQSGQVSFVEAVGTGGIGAHGLANPIGPDPLFSQGSIEASPSGVLATVNSGSNTVSVFSIDPKDPTKIQQIGAPVGSGGEFPMSLAIKEDGTGLCVLNGGQINGVSCFSVNQTLGLVPVPNTTRSLGLNQTTPATGPPGSTSQIIFSADGKQLIASVKGVPPTPGFLAVWDIVSDGSLSEQFSTVAPGQGGSLPFSMNLIPGTNALLASDPGIGFDIFDLSGISSQSGLNVTSSKNLAVPIPEQGAICWSSFSSKAGSFFLADVRTSILTEVSVGQNLQPSIIKQYPQANGSSIIDNEVATIGNNDFLFVHAAAASTVNVIQVNQQGNPQPVGSFSYGKPATQAGLTFDPNYMQGMTAFVVKS